MRPIPKDVPIYTIEPGRTMLASALMVHPAERYDDQYDILPSIDVALPDQDFTCDLGILPPRETDWLNDEIRVGPPITAFEIVMPTETSESLAAAIRTHYFANGVQSAWVISPYHKSIALLHPDQPAQVFTDGVIHDSVSGLANEVAKIFA